MATSYSLSFKLPNSSTWDSVRTTYTFWQLSSGSESPIAGTGAQTLIEAAMDNIVDQYGGSYTITDTDDGTYTTYYVTWTGLTSDPEDGATGALSAIALQDDNNDFFTAAFQAQAGAVIECDVCYDLQKQSCQSTYTFQLDLTPATTYTVAFYANNGNIYTQEVEAGGDGELVIDATAPEFPDGFFIPESGGYVVKVFTDTDLATVVPFVIGSNQYQCIQLSFAYVTTTTSSVQATFEYLIHDDDTDTNYFIIDDIGNNFIV